jgi:hypothetical protein
MVIREECHRRRRRRRLGRFRRFSPIQSSPNIEADVLTNDQRVRRIEGEENEPPSFSGSTRSGFADCTSGNDLTAMRPATVLIVWIFVFFIAGVWGLQVGRPPQAPLLREPRAECLRSSLWVCQAIFSGRLEMLIHAPFKILLQGQIPWCKKNMNNEKTKLVRQVAKVDLV